MAEKKPTKAEIKKRERDFKIAQKRLADRFDIDSQNAAIDADDAWRRLQRTRGPKRTLPTPAARVAPTAGRRALGMVGGPVGLGVEGMMYSPPADAPTLYDPSLIPGPANPRREQTARRMLADPYGFARGPQAARIPPRQLQPPPPMMADYFSGDIRNARGIRNQMQAGNVQTYNEIGQRYQPTGEDLLNVYPMDAGMNQPRTAGEPIPPMLADYFSGDIQEAQALRAQMQAELAQLYENEIGPRYQPTGDELLDVYPTDAGMTYPGAPGQPPMETFVDYQGPRPRDRNAAPEDFPQRIQDRRNLQEQMQSELARLYADEIGPRYQDVGEDLLNVYPMDAGMDRPAARPRQAPPPMLNDLFERMPVPQQQLPPAAPNRMQQRSLNPVLNAALGMRGMDVDLSGAWEPGMGEDIPLAGQFTPEGGMSPYEFGQDYLNPAGISAYEFGQEYLNPLITSPAVGYRALQEGPGRGIADLIRGAAGYEQLPEEQELIEAVDRPDLAMQPEAAPDPGAAQGITRIPADPYEQRQRALIEEYMMGQQQGDPRQRQIMGSADEFAANRPEPRMSQQQLDAALMQLAREESMQATDPFAGYDESLFPEQFVDDRFPRGVTVDPVTGATSFEGGQRYPRDAELTGRDSMNDLRLGTEYTSRALRNLGRARGVPSPQEVERSRLLSTLGGEAQGQGYRADQLAEQMDRIRSRLNSATLTPQELAAGQTQLETLGAELAAARGGAEQARRLQLQGSMQPPFPAPEDFELQQLQEAATAQAQAEADADQRRLLKELDIESRGRVDARDMQQYTEMFSEMEPSALPPGMSMANADPEIQEAEKSRVNRIQLATTLAASQEGFRTQPALAMEAARLLSTLRGDPKTQTAFMRVLLEASPDELGQLLQELYDDVGGL